MSVTFKVARNPDPESRLPYLVRLPIDGGIVLKARDSWPRLARVYCSQEGTPWDESAGLVDEVDVLVCHRRGAAVDLVDAAADPAAQIGRFRLVVSDGIPDWSNWTVPASGPMSTRLPAKLWQWTCTCRLPSCVAT